LTLVKAAQSKSRWRSSGFFLIVGVSRLSVWPKMRRTLLSDCGGSQTGLPFVMAGLVPAIHVFLC
jgi:hypothetical protein